MSDPSMGNRDMVEDGTAHKGGAVSSAALNETQVKLLHHSRLVLRTKMSAQ